jgi:hypothetical protein
MRGDRDWNALAALGNISTSVAAPRIIAATATPAARAPAVPLCPARIAAGGVHRASAAGSPPAGRAPVPPPSPGQILSCLTPITLWVEEMNRASIFHRHCSFHNGWLNKSARNGVPSYRSTRRALHCKGDQFPLGKTPRSFTVRPQRKVLLGPQRNLQSARNGQVDGRVQPPFLIAVDMARPTPFRTFDSLSTSHLPARWVSNVIGIIQLANLAASASPD